MIGPKRRRPLIDTLSQDDRVRRWIYGKSGAVIMKREGPVLVRQADLLVLQHGAIGSAENRQQHLLLAVEPPAHRRSRGVLRRVPIDVEVRGIARTWSVLQHVRP